MRSSEADVRTWTVCAAEVRSVKPGRVRREADRSA